MEDEGRFAPSRRAFRRRWRGWPRWKRSLALAVSLLLTAAIVASFINLDEYAIVPGDAQNVVRLIGAPARVSQHHKGSVLLTDVEIVQIRAVDYLFYRLNHDDDIEPVQSVTGPVSPSTYDEQGVIDMATARQAATFSALKLLGYKVAARPAGVIVYQLEPRSVARGTLPVGDVIMALNGHVVTSLASLSALTGALKPGDPVTLRVHLVGHSATNTLRVVLGSTRTEGHGVNAETICIPPGASPQLPPVLRDGSAVACLGIFVEQLYSTSRLPFDLNINSEGIIGPSAGLAFALGIIEKLDPVDIAAGKVVAATGTIDINGNVGPVGGVAQKTIAVEKAGARIFFVPAGDNYKTAEQHASPGLKVYPVSSLAQAVHILEQLGGAIAPPKGS